jgi:hypothetical protein
MSTVSIGTCGFSENQKGKTCAVILEQNAKALHCKTYCEKEYRDKILSLLRLTDLEWHVKIGDEDQNLDLKIFKAPI